MIKHFADTSALLHQAGLIDPNVDIAISPVTVTELEYIKEHEEDRGIRHMAREAVRCIMTGRKLHVLTPNNKKIDKLLKKYNFLSNINDHRILLAAELMGIEEDRSIIFLTSDSL